MDTVISVHLADVGIGTALGLVRKGLKPKDVAGLRHTDVGTAAPLSAAAFPRPTLRRVGLFGFWDDDEAIDRFEQDHPVAAALQGGWRARLEPLRKYGSWPGLSEDIPGDRHTEYDGPAVVLTLGRVRLTQLPRFLRTSAAAERSALEAQGSIWMTALARPPFVATCSLWESTKALSTYAYGGRDRGHPDAIDADQAEPFHKMSAFVRFRPYRVAGGLSGPNPLPEHALN